MVMNSLEAATNAQMYDDVISTAIKSCDNI